MSSHQVNRTDVRLRNQVPIKFLSKMAFFGLDGALAALEGRRNCAANIKKHEGAIKFRPRYKNPVLAPFEGRAITQYVPDKLLEIPFRALVEPMGKGYFLQLSENLSRSIKVKDIIMHLHGDVDLSGKISHIPQFKAQAIASISFHSQIYHRYGETHLEKDVLDYVFEKDQDLDEIRDELFSVHTSVGDWENEIFEDEYIIFHPIENLTIDALSLLGRWRTSSFEQISKEVSILPRLLGMANAPIKLSDPEFPEEIKKMSVFSLGSISHRPNVNKKMEILHRVGFCNIGDLLLFDEPYRLLFTNSNKRKKLSLLPKLRSQ
jgi:hypothetical protein